MTTCSRCGAEVRYGTRGATTGWLHRDPVDHVAILGSIATAETVAGWEAEMVRPRKRVSNAALKHCPTYQDLWPLEVYTTAEHDILRDPDVDRRRRRLAELHGQDPDASELIPDPEVVSHPVEPDSFPPRSGIRQIINLIDRTDGWERRRLTASRGPYMGSNGSVLSISDSIVLGARGPEVDTGVRVAVASWRDGKFDFAYTGILKDGIVTTSAANTEALKAWIRDTP